MQCYGRTPQVTGLAVNLAYKMRASDVIRVINGTTVSYTNRKRAVILVNKKKKAEWRDNSTIEITSPTTAAVKPTYECHIAGTFHWSPDMSGGYMVLQAKKF